MKPLAIALLASALLSGGAAAQTPSAADQIRARLEAWRAAFNARQAGPVCDLFARDLVADIEGQKPRGYATMCAALRRALADQTRRFRYDLDIKDVYASGALGAVRLVWTRHVEQAGQPVATISEVGIDILRRGPDGVWRIVRFVVYERQP